MFLSIAPAIASGRKNEPIPYGDDSSLAPGNAAVLQTTQPRHWRNWITSCHLVAARLRSGIVIQAQCAERRYGLHGILLSWNGHIDPALYLDFFYDLDYRGSSRRLPSRRSRCANSTVGIRDGQTDGRNEFGGDSRCAIHAAITLDWHLDWRDPANARNDDSRRVWLDGTRLPDRMADGFNAGLSRDHEFVFDSDVAAFRLGFSSIGSAGLAEMGNYGESTDLWARRSSVVYVRRREGIGHESPFDAGFFWYFSRILDCYVYRCDCDDQASVVMGFAHKVCLSPLRGFFIPFTLPQGLRPGLANKLSQALKGR